MEVEWKPFLSFFLFGLVALANATVMSRRRFFEPLNECHLTCREIVSVALASRNGLLLLTDCVPFGIGTMSFACMYGCTVHQSVRSIHFKSGQFCWSGLDFTLKIQF